MGMCTSGDIFQAKLDNMLGDIKGIKTYIDDILVLIKEILSKNTEQRMMIFCRLCSSGLKVNDTKCSFGLKEINYLGYLITRRGIKPDPRKVHDIMDLERPTTMTEAQTLIGMVQYYRDMRPIQSHILAPLIEADRGPKGSSTLWNDAL